MRRGLLTFYNVCDISFAWQPLSPGKHESTFDWREKTRVCLRSASCDLTSEILIIVLEGVLENVSMLLVFPPQVCLTLLVRMSEDPDMKYETHPRPRHLPGPGVANVLKSDILAKFRTQFSNLSLFSIWCTRARKLSSFVKMCLKHVMAEIFYSPDKNKNTLHILKIGLHDRVSLVYVLRHI